MRKANRAVLVEGYMDVIGVYAAGVSEVVASCGTALTNTQVRALHRHADTVVVNFDPDDAGSNAAERAIQLLLDEGLHVKVVAFGGGRATPDENVQRKWNADAYRAQLEGASSVLSLAGGPRAREVRHADPDGRMDAFRFLLPAVQKVSSPLERAAVANDLADYFGIDRSLVLDQFRKAAGERKAGVPRRTRKPSR